MDSFSAGLKLILGGNCLIDSNVLPCPCCKPGYGGFNCIQLCPNCETRLMSDNSCGEKCTDGYYGEMCDMPCSVNCMKGISGKTICDKKDGTCKNECIPGYFGLQCNLECSSKCHEKECIQIDGTCNSCKEKRYHGNQCSDACSDGCFNGTCLTNGKCIGGCKDGYYGDTCENSCGQHCNNSRCSVDMTNTFNCTDGCIDGFTSMSCSISCSGYCTKCHQYTGRCISCMSNYVKHCQDGDCETGIVSCEPRESKLSIYWLMTLIVLVPITTGIVVFIVCKNRRQDVAERQEDQMEEEMVLIEVQDGNTNPFTNKGLLHEACRNCNIQDIRQLISQPSVYINERDEYGRTPIMEAAEMGHIEVCQLLVKEGCDLSVVDDNKDTVLHVACYSDNYMLVQYLLDKCKHFINVRGFLGRTPVMIAARNGCKTVIDILVKNNCDLSPVDDNKDTCLNLACYHDNVDFVQDLLTKNIADINVRGFLDSTPVMIAARSGCKNVFALLVSRGCAMSVVDQDKDTILNLACYTDSLEIVSCILANDNANVNATGYMGRTAVMIAANYGCKRVFDLLIQKGCALTLRDDNNDTILHLACNKDNAEIVTYLLTQTNLDMNARGFMGRTVVMIAANNGCKRVFDLLIQKGCALTLSDDNNDTILHLACYKDNVEIVTYLLTQTNLDINARGFMGRTVVMIAANNGCKRVFDLLIQKGCALTLRDDNNDMILHLACYKDNVEIVTYLLTQTNLDMNAEGFEGRTAVTIAAVNKCYGVVEVLVTNKCKL